MLKYLTILMILLLSTASFYAQEKIIKGKKDVGIQKEKKVYNPEALNDVINFKNETGNSIITITDEDNNCGSIYCRH